MDGGVRLGLPLERAGAPDQRLQSGSQVGEAARVEAAAGVADVDQVLSLEDAEHEGAEVLSAAARLGESADHRLLSPMGFNLEPGVTACPFAVQALPVFGDDPFEPLGLGGLEEGDAAVPDVLAQVDVR